LKGECFDIRYIVKKCSKYPQTVNTGEFEMKRLCDFYIQHAGLIGAVYCTVPNLVWFFAALLCVTFRGVYLLRLVLSLVVGCAIASYLNRYGVDTWLCKHRSANGPATILDGILVGAAIGVGSALFPTLTVLISSSDTEKAKTIIIITYISATFVGAVFGSVLAAIARKYVGSIPTGDGEVPCAS
jgi:MFS family permease